MLLSRRTVLRSARAIAVAYGSLSVASCARSANNDLPLKRDPDGLLDLPEGFAYAIVTRSGEVMSDGFFRPNNPDGMACFPHPTDGGKCVLIRNHENWPDAMSGGPFGDDDALAVKLAEAQIFDRDAAGRPYQGGATTLVYDVKAARLERDYLSLAGTAGNCAGGATPWGSWLSCEESPIAPDEGAGKPHGWVFEVPAGASAPVAAIPLRAMGRFAHEAAAVDPHTDVVYMTEDERDGLIYRFLPNSRGALVAGGRLQALGVAGRMSADLRNWGASPGQPTNDAVEIGRETPVMWIDLENVEAPEGDLRLRGHAAGAALFCRGEGMHYGVRPGEAGAVYFTCTQGGRARKGQVWRYRPSSAEGSAEEKRNPGSLALVYESPGGNTLELCDNIAVSPYGDLILCEDGPGEQFLRALTPGGAIVDLARNALASNGEFCGACFSPNGAVMFVNIQKPGLTLAITGPWGRLPT